MAVHVFPVVQNYAWGKLGDSSAVARLSRLGERGAPADQPFAELWYEPETNVWLCTCAPRLGTHPSGPSTVTGGATLKSAVGHDLPFLFKGDGIALQL